MPSKIEWTEETWNPVTGCTRIAEGCRNCYAERLSHRFGSKGGKYAGVTKATPAGPRWTGEVRPHVEKLTKPLLWREPKMISVCSMSDLFHEKVPFEFIDRVIAVMVLCPHHTFQVLTKRPRRRREYFDTPPIGHLAAQESGWSRLPGILGEIRRIVLDRRTTKFHEQPCADPCWQRENAFVNALYSRNTLAAEEPNYQAAWPLPNVWQGYSASTQADLEAGIGDLLATPAAVRWLSLEPLVEPIDILYPKTQYPKGPTYCCSGTDCGCRGLPIEPPLICNGIPEGWVKWVVTGGESGPGARSCNVEWHRSIARQCKEADVPYFIKQLGSNIIAEVRECCGQKWMNGNGSAECPRCGDLAGCGIRYYKPQHSKGGDPTEWPEDLRIRDFPTLRTEPREGGG